MRLRDLVGESAVLNPFSTRIPVLDRDDECRAQRLRQSLGLRQRLVSWERQTGGSWMARISGPGVSVTIERTAKSRCRAILRAERAMNRIVESRPVNKPVRPPDDPIST